MKLQCSISGKQVGSMNGPEVDVAVDPLEGTEIVAKGLNNAMSVIAIANKGNLLHAPDMYMEKLAVGPLLVGKLKLTDPMEVTLTKAAEALNKNVSELTVMILDRVRHESIIKTLRKVGVRIKFLSDGDVAGAMAPAFPEAGIDLYVGSGGAPEGVLAAAALKCLGGEILGRLMPSDANEYARCLQMGIDDPYKVLTMEDMIGKRGCHFRGDRRHSRGISRRRSLFAGRSRGNPFDRHAREDENDTIHKSVALLAE